MGILIFITDGNYITKFNNMTLIELSEQVSQDLGNPDSPTVGVIQYWLRHNTFLLNNLINTGYTINATDGSISPEIGDQESAILKKMFFVYFYDTKVRGNLGAAAVDPVLEVSENGAVVRLTNRNSIALSFIQMRKQEQEELNSLITFYRNNNAIPQSVEGDDTTEQWYHGVSVSNTRIKLAT